MNDGLTGRPGIAKRFLRVSAAIASAVVISLALAVSVVRLAIPHAPEYRGEAARRASDALGAPVEISALDIRWRTLRPEVVLTGVRFVSADATGAFASPEVRVGLSVWQLLRYARFVPARITIIQPDVIVDIERGDTDAADRWRRLFEQRDRRGAVIVEDGRFELLMDSGRRRVALERVSGRVSSDGRNHAIAASARIADSPQGSLSLAMDAQGWPGEADLEGTARLDARGIELAAIQGFGRDRLEEGTLDLDLELEVRDGAAQRLSAGFGMARLNGHIQVRRAAGDIEWTRRDGGWDAALRNLAVGRESGTSESGSLEVGFTAPEGPDAAAHWAVAADRVVVEDFAMLASVVPWEIPGGFQAWFDRSPAGRIDHGEFSARHRAGAGSRWALRIAASSLSLATDPSSPTPGFTGVGVTLVADQDGGRAEIVGEDATLEFPDLFRDRLQLGRSVLEAGWTRSGGIWSVALTRIELENGDISLSGQGSAGIPDDGAGAAMKLEVVFRDAALAAKSPYLPAGIMRPALVEWLDAAVLGGTATSGRFIYEGALRAGALRDGGASMEIEFDAADITLDFADGWPAFTDGDARVRFTATGFDAQVHGGSLGVATIVGARVGIADFDDGELSIHGSAGDGLAESLAAFRETPVGRQQWLMELEGDGRAVVDLEITIPLQRIADTEVSGSVELQDASLGYRGMPGPLSAARGSLRIAGDQVTASAIEARFLGRPVSIGVTTGEIDDVGRGVTVVFAGSATADALAGVLERASLPAAGAFGWSAELTALFDDVAPPVLRIESDLVGLAIDLPEPVGKSADDARRVVADLVLSAARRALSIDGGPVGRFDAEFVTTDGEWRIARGRVHLGDGEAPGLPDSDLALTGRLSAWPHGGELEPTRNGVSMIDMVIGDLSAFGRGLGEVRVRGTRLVDAWAWRFDGDRLTGDVEVPDDPAPERPIRADLERLDLPVPGATAGGAEPEPDARAVAPIAFHVGDFTLGIVHLGEINGVVRRVENGISMEAFTATRRDMRITADASWHTVDGHHRTVLRGTLDSTDVRRTLAALGYRGSIDAAAGHLQVDLNWLGSPLRDPLGILNGTASVRLERGQLSDVQAGAGRVFGLLSVNALPRRLALDFSDVFGRGLAFDTIQGDFRVEDGDAYTGALVMQGPAARITASGRTGLAARDYDQEMVVIGTFRTSLALAGTLAGGPGVGAALLIAAEILKRPLEDLARVRYRLTGPWEDPEFERLQEGRGEPR